MLNITYAVGPEVPSCGRSLQTSNGGIIHDTLISVAGFGIPTIYIPKGVPYGPTRAPKGAHLLRYVEGGSND